MKSSEKRLLFSLLGLLVLGAFVVVSDFYFDKRDLLLAEKSSLDDDWTRIQTLLEERGKWDIRAHWLENNQPRFTNTDTIDESIFEEVLSVDFEGVETSNQTLLPSVSTPDYNQAGASVEARGDLPSLFRWLYDLSQPGSFRVIRNLKITPSEQDPETLVARFQLLRWYTPSNS